jgi:CBS domain-containing protein
MKIKNLMSKDVEIVSPATSIEAAAQVMRDRDVGILPVGEGDRLVGMVSDRDLVVRGLAAGKSTSDTPVKDVMSSEQVLYCFEDETPAQVAANMANSLVRRLPVLNRDKRLVGIVSIGDLSARGSASTAGKALGDIARTQ